MIGNHGRVGIEIVEQSGTLVDEDCKHIIEYTSLCIKLFLLPAEKIKISSFFDYLFRDRNDELHTNVCRQQAHNVSFPTSTLTEH